ncbi:MAG: fasciclin domain-containing protein, partial [Bacteroidota bacterium]
GPMADKFTVFAPTEDAFAAFVEANGPLPEGDALADVLLYHVASGSNFASSFSDGDMVPTLQGASLDVTIAAGTVSVNGIPVATADVRASNGVVHVLTNGILVPPAAP